MKVLTKALIKESEENAVKSGAFSFRELMLRAGTSAAEIIMSKYDCRGKKISVICGKGNNGGDGCVISWLLSEHGADVTVVTPFGPPATENAAYYYNKLENVKKSNALTEEKPDIIIDALFGIGLDRELDDKVSALINRINASDCVRISVDIPSGVEADSGSILGTAVEADLTVTFIALKPCFMLPDGSDYCGEVIVSDIGVEPVGYDYLTVEKPIFKKRRHNSHKGTFGTALMLCGSYGMAGAAILSAKAALRSGVGIVKAVLCDGIYAAFTSSVPEAVCIPVPQSTQGTLSPDNIDIQALLSSCNAVLIGCGLGSNYDTARLTQQIVQAAGVPVVIDADGINSICGCIDIIKKSKAPVIITPHPGEMARLCSVSVSEIEGHRIEYARRFAKEYGCYTVLKGADTIIALPSGEIFFNLGGNPGMSVGGSGDLLAGITVSLLAQGIPPCEAVKAAVYLHSEAGDKAAKKRGERAMLPSDMIEEL